jgi:putative oxidoreductase
LVFIIASWHKIMDPETFALDVAAYQLFPLWAIDGFALVMPWLELLTRIMLILGLRARAAVWVILFMMLSFIFFPTGRLVYETNDLHLDSDDPCCRYRR